jgi:hypothetical protein
VFFVYPFGLSDCDIVQMLVRLVLILWFCRESAFWLKTRPLSRSS